MPTTRTRRVARRWLTVTALAVIVAACVPIKQVDFANFTFAPDACGEIIKAPPADGYQLVDGSVRHGRPADADFYSVSLRQDIAFGDLTGDGIDEAALILDCSPGNRPVPIGRVMTVDGGTAHAIAIVPSPDLPADSYHSELIDVRIADEVLVAEWLLWHDGDPWCCPTGWLTTNLHWDGSQFSTPPTTVGLLGP